jgi:hypothetical protein
MFLMEVLASLAWKAIYDFGIANKLDTKKDRKK